MKCSASETTKGQLKSTNLRGTCYRIHPDTSQEKSLLDSNRAEALIRLGRLPEASCGSNEGDKDISTVQCKGVSAARA